MRGQELVLKSAHAGLREALGAGEVHEVQFGGADELLAALGKHSSLHESALGWSEIRHMSKHSCALRLRGELSLKPESCLEVQCENAVRSGRVDVHEMGVDGTIGLSLLCKQ